MVYQGNTNIMSAFPVVEYVNSDMNILTQNWRKFLTDRYLPVSPICPSCNGIVHATTPEHVYAGHYSYLSLDGTIIPTRAFWAIENAVIAEYTSYLSKNPNAAQPLSRYQPHPRRYRKCVRQYQIPPNQNQGITRTVLNLLSTL